MWIAVSYTHLDVYKRQVYVGNGKVVEALNENLGVVYRDVASTGTVSYTHLGLVAVIVAAVAGIAAYKAMH